MNDYWHLVLGHGVRSLGCTPLYEALGAVAVYMVREPGGVAVETAIRDNGDVVCSCDDEGCSHRAVTRMHHEYSVAPRTPAA